LFSDFGFAGFSGGLRQSTVAYRFLKGAQNCGFGL
jgi:hypothetical protein